MIHKSLLFCLILITLFGCDYTYHHYYVVKNETNNNITVGFTNKYRSQDFVIQKLTLLAGEQFMIDSALGTKSSNEQVPDIHTNLIEEFSILSVHKNNDSLPMNFLERKYWNYHVVGNNKGYYTLIIK